METACAIFTALEWYVNITKWVHGREKKGAAGAGELRSSKAAPGRSVHLQPPRLWSRQPLAPASFRGAVLPAAPCNSWPCAGQSRWAFVAGICSTILIRGAASPSPTSGAIKPTSIREATLETVLWRIHIQLSIHMCHRTNFLVQSRFMQVQFQLIFNDSGKSAHITARTSSG